MVSIDPSYEPRVPMDTFRSSLETFRYIPDQPSALTSWKQVKPEARMHVKQEQQIRPLTPPRSVPDVRRSSRKRRAVELESGSLIEDPVMETLELSSSVGPLATSTNSKVTKKKRKATRPYADPSLYAHLPQSIPDHLKDDLTLLICGLNPGVMTARTGHHFSNPTNLFWPLLYSSGIITHPFRAPDSHRLVTDFNIGITNIVSRPTAEGGELDRQECRDGARRIVGVVARIRPRAVMFTGKGIWESVFYVLHGRPLRKSDAFVFGWQKEILPYANNSDVDDHDNHDDLDERSVKLEDSSGINSSSTTTDTTTSPPSSIDRTCAGKAEEETRTGCRIFVTMGTSGRVAGYTPAYKREVFNQLGAWMTQQRANAEVKTEPTIQAQTDTDRLFTVEIVNPE